MKYWIFLLALSVALLSEAQQRSQQALSYQKTAKSFTAKLKPGFHFNDKAPNSLISKTGLLKPQDLQSNQITFSYDQEPQEGRAQLYVCDDAITFCETHLISLQEKGKIESTSSLNASKLKKISQNPDSHGFIQDDFASALDLAKNQKKLLLVDFTAAWCPSCRRLDQEVFSTPAFAKYKKDFIFVKVDTDRFQNSVLSEKYKIVGIPTILFLDAEQTVLAQILDYQPLDRFEKLMQSVLQNPTPISSQLEHLSKLSEEAKQTLGFRLYYAGNYDEAAQTWTAMKAPPKDLAQAQYYAASEKFEKETLLEKDFKDLLQSLLKKENDSARSLVWRRSLLEMKDLPAEERTRLFQEGLQLADSILAQPHLLPKSLEGDLKGDLEGHEDFIVANYRADLFEANKSPHSEIQAAWEKSVAIGEKSNFKPEDLGPALRFLSVMAQAKSWEKGHLWLSKLKKAHPQYPDLLRREVRFLVELKKYPEAVKIGEQALKKSYERNHFWVIEYLAKAYVGNGQKEKARHLIQSYLSKPEMDVKALASTKKSLTKLQDHLDSTEL